MKKLAILLFLAPGFIAAAGQISDYYYKQLKENTNWVEKFALADRKSRTLAQIESTNHGVTEIAIERSGCFGSCPVYTFIARSDGSFRYKGERFVQRTGEYSGTIPIWQFHELAKFILDSGYLTFEERIVRRPIRALCCRADGKVISNYANSGPTALWAIEQLIDDLMDQGPVEAGIAERARSSAAKGHSV